MKKNLTKTDLIDQEILEMQIEELKKAAKNSTILSVSSITHTGTKQLLHQAANVVKDYLDKQHQAKVAKESELPVITLPISQPSWEVKKIKKGKYLIISQKIERFAKRTNFDQPDAVNRLKDIIRKHGISSELVKQGIEPGDRIIIGKPSVGELDY
jgi:Obg family GTPase CgtA-like protein